MGHEAAGIVTEAGSQVRGWQPGERVTFDSNIYCGVCRYCRKGMINLCDSRRVLGVSCAEFRQGGALAECVAVPQQCVYHLPDALSFERDALVRRETPRLCRGGSRSLTNTGVHRGNSLT
jgi:L-iditol 2-dehydrogenase